MQPRPIYRWKSFWLGVLTVACIAFGWWCSMGSLRAVGASHLGFIQAGGGVSLTLGGPVKAGWRFFRADGAHHVNVSQVTRGTETYWDMGYVPVESPPPLRMLRMVVD